MAKPRRFAHADAPWVEETAWIYQRAGLFSQFANDAGLVAAVVAAFEAAYARPPKWNTAFENQRILALDNERTSALPLLDLDRQPPLRGLYAKALAEWVRIAAGAFPATEIREEWSPNGRTLKVTLKLRGKLQAVTPHVYRHGQFDLTIIEAVNKLLPAKGPKLLVVKSDGQEPTSLVVALDAKMKATLERDRGFVFMGPADFKRMTQVFADREKEWAAEDQRRD